MFTPMERRASGRCQSIAAKRASLGQLGRKSEGGAIVVAQMGASLDRVERDEYGLALYPPGVVVPPGRYVREDRRWAPPLVLDRPDVLPASPPYRRPHELNPH